jgi:hypothetical protein
MNKHYYYQQGDCLIKRIDVIPAGAKETDRSVLVEGEHTGHAHRLARNASAVIMVLGAVQYLRVYSDTPVEHEEHDTQIIPPGDYQIDQVREFDHFAEEARRVMD